MSMFGKWGDFVKQGEEWSGSRENGCENELN